MGRHSANPSGASRAFFAVLFVVAAAVGGYTATGPEPIQRLLPGHGTLAGTGDRSPAGQPSPGPTRVLAAAVPGEKPASRSQQQRRPLPTNTGTGRRIVYSLSLMHVWLVDAKGKVVRDFPVIGRRDKPKPGTYRVYSKSPTTFNPDYGVTIRYMVRFTYGSHLPIGFHDLPRTKTGEYFAKPADLGKPVGRGGCASTLTENAKFLYTWTPVGTKVVVVR